MLFMKVNLILYEIGNFIDNEISGYGVYKWIDGREYIGYWLDNKMHGEGTLKWPDGKCYKGVT